MKLSAVLGQAMAVEAFGRALATRDHGAGWLLYGPPGTGKRTAAMAFAASLNCQSPDLEGHACGGCRTCTDLERGLLHEVRVVEPDPESGGRDRSFKLAVLHALATWASRVTPAGRVKVGLVEDAHLMSREAANAFLKILEEPPPRTVFLLLAPSRTAVLPTVRSRCRPVRFTLLSRTAVEWILRLQGHPEAEEAAALTLGRLDTPLEEIQAAVASAEGYLGLARQRDLMGLSAAAQALGRKDGLPELVKLLDGLERVLAERLRLHPEDADRWIAALDAVGQARWRYRGSLTKVLVDGLGADLSRILQPAGA